MVQSELYQLHTTFKHFFDRAEYSAFWKCVQAGAAYLFTQLCKMLVLATFFPSTEFSTGGVDVLGVCLNYCTSLHQVV